MAKFTLFDDTTDQFDVSDIAGGGVRIDITTMIGTQFEDSFAVNLFEFEQFDLNGMILSRNALSAQFNLAPVPLPASAVLLIGGLMGLGRLRRRVS